MLTRYCISNLTVCISTWTVRNRSLCTNIIIYHFVRRSDCTYIIYHGPVYILLVANGRTTQCGWSWRCRECSPSTPTSRTTCTASETHPGTACAQKGTVSSVTCSGDSWTLTLQVPEVKTQKGWQKDSRRMGSQTDSKLIPKGWQRDSRRTNLFKGKIIIY